MSVKYNVNAIMCASSNEEVTRIDNIFNSVKLDNKGCMSFDVVTFVSCIGEPTDFVLAYIMQHKIKEDEGPVTFLNAIEYSYEGEKNVIRSIQNIERMQCLDVKMDGEGHYALIVYMYDMAELNEAKVDFKEDFENWIEKLDNSHIECIYEFDVRY